MTIFYLVRHGDTAWNRDWRYRGQADLPLDESGLAQARATAGALGAVGLEAVFASPLKRAFNTAELIAQAAGLTARPLPDLLDISYGAWQGMTYAEAQAAYPDLYARWQAAPHLVHFPAGESLDEVRSRSVHGLLAIADQYPRGRVAIVGHQVVNRVLLCAVLGLANDAFWRIEQDTCCINVFRYDTERYRFTVERINDAHHLSQIQTKG
jgi:broad specificity phosphatase PhoE